jgi:hypothetical protein
MLAINIKYEKSDQEIITHVFAHLPRLYESTVKAICNNGKKNTLEEVKKGLTTKWKTYFGKNNKGKFKLLDYDIEEALNVDESKKNNFKKKIKGDCCNCGKQGHKVVDCWQKKGKPEGKKKTFNSGNDSTRKCFRCNKMGHIMANCPDKD